MINYFGIIFEITAILIIYLFIYFCYFYKFVKANVSKRSLKKYINMLYVIQYFQ